MCKGGGKMGNRSKYLMIVALLLVIVNVIGVGVLLTLLQENTITVIQSRVYYMIASFTISIVVMLFILYEGKEYSTTYAIAMLFIVSRVIDVYRYYTFPYSPFEINLVYMWCGAIIFILGFVYLNVVILRERFAFLMLATGVLIMIRVLYGADLLLLYVKKYVLISRENVVYFGTSMVVYYAILFVLVLALKSITEDNFKYHRTTNKDEYERNTLKDIEKSLDI